ncbi:hypothetical protein HHI36_005160 [Cryptolaemus montrouzieri]|uniref:Uncharacterized protein n=1 Tax=Cryptolaemus montrouzieri TaxID=559131 RepID=A0ABD2NTU2_9CUCU
MYSGKEERLDHILSGCPALASKSYLDGHNRVANILHQELRVKYMGLKSTVPHYLYEPPNICDDEKKRLDRQTNNQYQIIFQTLCLRFKKRRNKKQAEDLIRIKQVEIDLRIQPEEEVQGPILTNTTDAMSTPSRFEEDIESMHMKYDGIDPNAKPGLPKLIFKTDTSRIMHEINNIV